MVKGEDMFALAVSDAVQSASRTQAQEPMTRSQDDGSAIACTGDYNLCENNLDGLVAYQRSTNGTSLVSSVDLLAGSHFCYITSHVPQSEKSWRTIQTSATTHTELKSALLYLNHSCQPSLELHVYAPDDRGRYPRTMPGVPAQQKANTESVGLAGEVRVASDQDLQIGDALTFWYPSTEWYFDRAFDCDCGAPSDVCIGKLEGAHTLATETLQRYFVNEHIRDLARARDTSGQEPSQ